MRPAKRLISAQSRAFYFQFTELAAAVGIHLSDRSITRDASRAMLNWLTGNCDLFGLAGQNWMLVVAGGLLLYIAALAICRRRHAGVR